jgi:beta-aspartyl-peptidase (threonine type)
MRPILRALSATLLFALSAVIVLHLATSNPTPATKIISPRQDVARVLNEQIEAWNKGDLNRFMDTYWDSDELTFYSGGTVTKGRKAVAERYRKTYQADGKEMGKLSFSEMDVQELGPDAALARARWKLVTSKETVEGLFTLILRKFPDGWKIVHDHTSRTDPPKK